jgi:hypothetical protein
MTRWDGKVESLSGRLCDAKRHSTFSALMDNMQKTSYLDFTTYRIVEGLI